MGHLGYTMGQHKQKSCQPQRISLQEDCLTRGRAGLQADGQLSLFQAELVLQVLGFPLYQSLRLLYLPFWDLHKDQT